MSRPPQTVLPELFSHKVKLYSLRIQGIAGLFFSFYLFASALWEQNATGRPGEVNPALFVRTLMIMQCLVFFAINEFGVRRKKFRTGDIYPISQIFLLFFLEMLENALLTVNGHDTTPSMLLSDYLFCLLCPIVLLEERRSSFLLGLFVASGIFSHEFLMHFDTRRLVATTLTWALTFGLHLFICKSYQDMKRDLQEKTDTPVDDQKTHVRLEWEKQQARLVFHHIDEVLEPLTTLHLTLDWCRRMMRKVPPDKHALLEKLGRDAESLRMLRQSLLQSRADLEAVLKPEGPIHDHNP